MGEIWVWLTDVNFAVYKKLGIEWATSLFGFISIALIPIPWVLFRWGAEIRAKSKMITSGA